MEINEVFSTNYEQMWAKEVRPCIVDVMNTCKTDEMLVETLGSLLNHADSDVVRKLDFSFRLDPIIKTISAERYYKNTLRDADKEESTKVKTLSDKLLIFQKVMRYDFSSQLQEEVVTIKDRLPNQAGKDPYEIADNSRRRLF